MKYSSRFFLYAPLGVFLLLLAVVGIHWWIAATHLGNWLDGRNGREIMPGVTLSFSTRHITGFPFSLDTQLHDVRLTIAAPHGPTRWQSEKFAMHALTYGREETIFEAAGHQILTWTRPDGSTRTLAFAVGSLHASAIVQHDALTRFDLDLIGFGSQDFTAQRLQLHARRSDLLQLRATADGLRAARCARPALRALEFRINVAKPDALVPLLSGREAWNGAIARWRHAGGRIAAGSGFVINPPDQMPAPAPHDVRAEDLAGIAALADAVCGR